jgi:DNA-binding transcriptional ArsR family regulator
MANAKSTDALGALSDPTRRRLFEQLGTAGPLPVGELADSVPVSRPAVSQHLKVLKDAGLVFDRADGTRRLYQVDPNGIAALRDYLDAFWDQALASFKAHVEEDRHA